MVIDFFFLFCFMSRSLMPYAEKFINFYFSFFQTSIKYVHDSNVNYSSMIFFPGLFIAAASLKNSLDLQTDFIFNLMEVIEVG